MAQVTHRTIRLPATPFFYTLDQVALMMGFSQKHLDKFLYYQDRSTKKWELKYMTAVNMADPGDKPDWRISEREFVRWLRLHRYTIQKQT